MSAVQPEWVKDEWLENRRELLADGWDLKTSGQRKIREVVAYGRGLFPTPPITEPKFVVFAQGRTGSELLVSLLNNHPRIHCEGELLNAKLNTKIVFPQLYVQGRRAKYPEKAYGFKVKIYQLTEDQHTDPQIFMHGLQSKGWKVIYLQRENLLRNSISCILGFQRNKWHDRSKNPLKEQKFTMACDRLLYELERRDIYTEKEAEILERIDHIKIVYERDLLGGENHQNTCDRLFAYLGLPSVGVRAKLKKTTSNRLSDFIENYEEIESAIAQTKYAKYLSY